MKPFDSFDWDSDPIINIHFSLPNGDPRREYSYRLQTILVHAPHHFDMKPVEFHKNRLGKQKLCYFNGEFRFWVWEGENWRVFVNNHKGICFDVREGISPEDAYVALLDYSSRMNIRSVPLPWEE